MKIKLIAVDLDGTLLTSRKKVSPKTLATLKKAREKGKIPSGNECIGGPAIAGQSIA